MVPSGRITAAALLIAAGLLGGAWAQGAIAGGMDASGSANVQAEIQERVDLDTAIREIRAAIDEISELTAAQRAELKAKLTTRLQTQFSAEVRERARVRISAEDVVRAIRTAVSVQNRTQGRLEIRSLVALGLDVARLSAEGASRASVDPGSSGVENRNRTRAGGEAPVGSDVQDGAKVEAEESAGAEGSNEDVLSPVQRRASTWK